MATEISSIISSADLTLEQKREFWKRARITVERKHRQYFNFLPEAIRVRDLLPRDLGLESWIIPAGTMHWINHQLKPATTIILYKILNLSPEPTLTELEFLVVGMNGVSELLGIQNIESCYAILAVIKNLGQLRGLEIKDLHLHLNIPMEAYFTDPYLFKGSGGRQRIIINITARGNEENHLLIGGFICEPLGKTVG